ncbi:MAG: hypothetical protein A3H36_00960 [Chloroflexi bacterium RIFCSPLOWO2_02_FULL_71_16]|nr:MAG: hypothetical protein A3H36_00960 [Chloroflexi bacterium RIFCSPLOWO2_02_FULL_71_16]
MTSATSQPSDVSTATSSCVATPPEGQSTSATSHGENEVASPQTFPDDASVVTSFQRPSL